MSPLKKETLILLISVSLLSFLSCKKHVDNGTNGTGNGTALGKPTVTTAIASSVTSTSAVLGGSVTDDSGSSVLERGICFSINPNPTTANTKILIGTGTGNFSTSVSSLLPNTLYYVRAYASNAVGLNYGNQQSFTTSAPVLEDSVVSLYIGGGTSLHAFNAQTGALKWQRDLGNYVSSSPAYANGKVYIGCSNKLYAYDSSGNALWNFTTVGTIVTSSPVVENNIVYFNTEQSKDIYALNAQTGTQIWHFTAPDNASFNTSNILLYNNTLFINAYWLYAIDASTGALKWKVPRTNNATPQIINNKIYVTQTSTNNVNHSLLALDINTGATLWEKVDNTIFDGTIAFSTAKEKLFISSGSGIYAVDTINGSLIWHANAQISSFIQVGNCPLIVGDETYSRETYRITVHNAQTGAFVWQSLGEQVSSNMTIVNNTLFYAGQITVTPTTRYYLFAVDLSTRTTYNYKWVSAYAATLPYLISSPCVVTKSGKAHRFGNVFN
jgi:outer membrane protein assembly factor BamB